MDFSRWISPIGEKRSAWRIPITKDCHRKYDLFWSVFFSGEGNFVKLLNYEFNDYRRQRIQSCKKNLSRHIQEHKLCFETFLSITL